MNIAIIVAIVVLVSVAGLVFWLKNYQKQEPEPEPETWREFLAHLASTKEAKKLGLRLRIMDVGGEEFTPENFLKLYREAVALPMVEGSMKIAEALWGKPDLKFRGHLLEMTEEEVSDARRRLAKLAAIIAARAAKEVGLHLVGKDVAYVEHNIGPSDYRTAGVNELADKLMSWLTIAEGERHILAISRPATKKDWVRFLRAWVKTHGWKSLRERDYPMSNKRIIVPTQDCWVEPRNDDYFMVLVPPGINVRIVDKPGYNKFYFYNEDGTVAVIPKSERPPLFSDIDLSEVV